MRISDWSSDVCSSDLPDAMDRSWLCEAEMVTTCAPSHAFALATEPIPMDEFGLHVQVVVTDNQPEAEKTQQGVAGKRQWLVNDLGAKRDLLKAGLGWGHLPRHLVADDLAGGQLVELERRAWHIRPLTFMVSQSRGYDLSPCESRLRSEEHTSELQSLMRISYAVFCLKKKNTNKML